MLVKILKIILDLKPNTDYNIEWIKILEEIYNENLSFKCR